MKKLLIVLMAMTLFSGLVRARAATDWSAAVPDDRVEPLGFKVGTYPTSKELAQEFERYHQQSEKLRNADGSWGSGYGKAVKPPVFHPLVRDMARRILAYIDAYQVTQKAIYRQRAKEGLDYLLKEQQPDGQFIWWYGDPVKGRKGGGASLYVTAIPTAALVEGYKLTKDPRYLAAANKAAEHMCGVPNVRNANYNLFATWGLAANYEVTKNDRYLQRSTEFALHAIKGQLPSGMWSDSHNQKVWYHGIILRGLVKLLSVMPDDHPARPKIRQATYRTLNQLRLRQTPDGRMHITPSDKSKLGWNGLSAQSLAMTAYELKWPVEDYVHLTAKGISSRTPEDDQRGGTIMGIGSLMRAYRSMEAGSGASRGK